MSLITLVLVILILILLVIAYWKILVKAGRHGWIAMVPFYNFWTLSKIGSKPSWWGLGIIFSYVWLDSHVGIIFRLFSLICFVVYFQVSQGVARNFKKSTVFGVILAVLPFIGYPILGYGQATYKKLDPKSSKKA